MMNDFAFLAIIFGFFAIAVFFVRACDRVIGADDDAFAEPWAGESEEETVAA